MPKYSYKGFNITFDIELNEHDLYEAHAKVICNAQGSDNLVQQFQTVSDSKSKASHEIKRLIKNYIDFEWKEFLKMQGEQPEEALYHRVKHKS